MDTRTITNGLLVVSTSTRDDFADYARLHMILKDRLTVEHDANGTIISMAVSTLCLAFDGHKLSVENIGTDQWDELHGTLLNGEVHVDVDSLEEKPTRDGLGTILVGQCQLGTVSVKKRPKIEASITMS